MAQFFCKNDSIFSDESANVQPKALNNITRQQVGPKGWYFVTIYTGVTKRREIVVFFLSLYVCLSVSFLAVRGIWLDPTKRPQYCQVYSTDDIYTEWVGYIVWQV